jgi:SAM-dependent methyltransferase
LGRRENRAALRRDEMTGWPSAMLARARRMYRSYFGLVSPSQFMIRRFIRSHEGRFRTERCLDIGGGTSPYEQQLRRSFGVRHYISSDIVSSDRTLLVADACRLPLADATLDLVAAIEVIQHIPDYHALLGEAHRTLSAGGHLFVTYLFVYGECGVHDFHRWTKEGMETDIRAAGFKIISHETKGGALYMLTVLASVLVNNIIPGGRKTWRTETTVPSILRLILIIALGLPFRLLGFVAYWIDRLLPIVGFYVGGMVLARREEP